MANKDFKRLYIFSRALLIVLLTTSNVVFISNKMYIFAILISAGISLMWTLNVKDLAICCWKDRMAYIIGGIIGTTISLYSLDKLLN